MGFLLIEATRAFMRPLALLAFAVAAALAQTPVPSAAARQWRIAHEKAVLEEFVALLSIPNVARNLDDMQRNAAHIRQMMERRGIRTELLSVPDAPAAIYGELATPGARGTIAFYAHYDGQPVDPSQWATPPFEPVIRDGRIYARSASDDKAPILALMTALDGLRNTSIALKSNVKFFLDGEEEAGSPHLEAILRKYQSRLGADAWIFCDGPVHQTRRQQIVFGVRGSTGFQLTVYGPVRELHSGHYGNWAPNPAAMLVRLLASMRDDDGRVLVRGFYDNVEPLSDADKAALAALPNIEGELRDEFELGRTEGGGKRLEELIALPALNIQGLLSAGTGATARNVVPATATAAIGIRLVKGMDHERTVDKVVEHIRSQGYFVIDRDPSPEERRQHQKIAKITNRGGYNAVRAPMDSAIARKVIQAVKRAHGGDVILMPTLGGSLPIAPITGVLKVPVLIVPIANHDNNQHAHNENIRLENLWDGIETMAELLAIE